MINDLFSFLYSALSGSIFISLLSSFLWGVSSVVLSPCHLSSIPLIIGYLNRDEKVEEKRPFLTSLMFSLGILITIALIGITTAAMGRLIGDIGEWGTRLVAIVFFIFGLYLLDIIPISFNFKMRSTNSVGLSAALILGLIFGLALGPCTFAFLAPVLGVVFTLAEAELIKAILLILMFAIGHCAIIVLAALATKKVQKYLNWTEKSKIQLYLKRICGIFVIGGGIYLLVYL